MLLLFNQYLQFLAIVLAAVAAVALLLKLGLFRKVKSFSLGTWVWLGLLLLSGPLYYFQVLALPFHFAMPPFLQSVGPGGTPASLPFIKALEFMTKAGTFETVADIAVDPTRVPQTVVRNSEGQVEIYLETKEVIGKLADGVEYNYWTFNDTVPGPFLRVREGDMVKLTLRNNPTSIHDHNIDLHAVTGPGGGATVTTIKPGETKTFTFKALNTGLFVYHCAHPNAASHMAHGMYGLILVEPKEGLPKVDREFYVMQGEFYTTSQFGTKGLAVFDAQKMLDGKPEYVVFNGRVNGTVSKLTAQTGEKVRLFVGNGGVNLISSFHVIGEIFDEVYPEASMGTGTTNLKNVQTTVIPAGGAAITEFAVNVPGKYILVDHALSRMDRGAWGTLDVTGDPNPKVFQGVLDNHSHGH